MLVLALLVFGLREPQSAGPIKEPVRLTLKPFGRDFKLYLVALGVFTLGNASDAFLLVRAGELGVPVALLPVLWTAFHVAKSGGNWLAGRAVDRLGPRPFILVGWLTYAAVYLAFAFATAAWQAWVLFVAYAVFYSLTEPAEKKLVADLAGGQQKGLAYGWFNFAVGVTTLPASLAVRPALSRVRGCGGVRLGGDPGTARRDLAAGGRTKRCRYADRQQQVSVHGPLAARASGRTKSWSAVSVAK